jgi:aminobenzoyl-glutamate utilization protein B
MKPDTKVKTVRREVSKERRAAEHVATRIWELAEPPLREHESARVLAEYLGERGFEVEFPFAQIPTAFRAVAGKGKPVIGFLGEYDALPDCGARKGTFGHACGHNLLGTASAVAAAVARRMLAENGKPGRLVYWGCPAEEALAGKVYMARDGAFRGMDACLAWHPGSQTAVSYAGGAALDSLVFAFHGQTAHGAYAEGGRSALDAAMIMDVAANYLREHVPDNVRMHCVIPHGGNAPNVVPELARIWYYVRARDRAQVDEITRRLRLCARGAATATETRMRMKRLTSVYSRLRNRPLADLVLSNLKLFGAPRASAKDKRLVEDLGKEPDFASGVVEPISENAGFATSDEDNVSWLAPLGGFTVACVARSARGHHRDYTAQSNLPFAHRGMLKAAEVMAATAWDLATQPKLLAAVGSEFRKGTKDFTYDPLIPARQRPPVGDPI